MTKLLSDDVPTLVRDCYEPRLHFYYQRLILKTRPTVQLFSGSAPFTLCILTPPPIHHTETELHRSFALYFPPSLRSWAAWPNKLPSHQPPPPVLHFLSCLPQPGPHVSAGPCSPAPLARFFYIVPCPASPLFLPSTSIAPLSTPVGSFF